MAECIAFDTETFLIRQGLKAPPMVCLSYFSEGSGELLHVNESYDIIKGWLESDVHLIGHNTAFDMAVIAAQWPDLVPAIFEKYERDEITDTIVRQKLIDIAKGERKYRFKKGKWYKPSYNMEDLVFWHFKKRVAKGEDTWRKRYGELIDTPVEDWPEAAISYAVKDAEWTYLLWEKQEEINCTEETSNGDWFVDEHRQACYAWWMELMKIWGIRTDPDGVRRLIDETKKAHDVLKARLIEAGLVRKNGVKNKKAAQERMIEAMGGEDFCKKTKPSKTFPEGQVQVDADACELSGDVLLKDYAELTSLGNVLSKDVPALFRGQYLPVHSYFDTLKETGRTSSSGPNIQNIRRLPGIRECFVPRPGKVFVDADYDGLELRTLGQVCISLVGYSALADALNAGQDAHLFVAAKILGIDYDEALRRLKADDEEVDNARQLAKAANFGFPGGLGVAALIDFARKAYGIQLTEMQVKRLKQDWMRAFPEMKEYFAIISRMTDTPDGTCQIKQLFSERVRGQVKYTVACNTFFQGLGADATKTAGFFIAKACYADPSSVLYGSRIVNYIHDQFILECDEAVAHEVAMELKRIMEHYASIYLPDCPATVSKPVVARVWSKKAKQVWEDGKLIPWEYEKAA